MTGELQRRLEKAILSGAPLEDIVSLLRGYKSQGVAQDEVYSFLESLRGRAPNEATDDRILEVADFVAGFCSPHMRIWEEALR
jgi:hypothetical protein